jgi:hypothetical protein
MSITLEIARRRLLAKVRKAKSTGLPQILGHAQASNTCRDFDVSEVGLPTHPGGYRGGSQAWRHLQVLAPPPTIILHPTALVASGLVARGTAAPRCGDRMVAGGCSVSAAARAGIARWIGTC